MIITESNNYNSNQCFSSIISDSKWDKVQHECIKCLKAIMNNKVGLKDMFEHKEALTLMARSLNPNLPHVMQVCSLQLKSRHVTYPHFSCEIAFGSY